MATLQNLSRSVVILWCLVVTVSGGCTCEDEHEHERSSRSEALKFKLGAIASILVAGAIGVSIPVLGNKFKPLRPENDVFFMIKAFAAGVILSTGFVHILPEAFKTLSSPCLAENPWRKFPFTGFISMAAAIGTLMVDTVATSFFENKKANKSGQVNVDEERSGHGHVHSHATHGLDQGDAKVSHSASMSDIIRQRVITQVLELGIVVHSVIIGISLGASQSTDTIKPLMAALSFHQLFEGMGLGGCISQAKFKSLTTAIMTVCFSLTAPIGIGIGIGISSFYKDNSSNALAVEGIFNSASAGILIYMALVDLLAADFMNPRMQSNLRLQLGAYVSLLLGSGCMSFLAKWA